MGINPPTFLCHPENEGGVVLVWAVGEVGGDEQLHGHTAVTVGCAVWGSAWKTMGNLHPVGMLIDRRKHGLGAGLCSAGSRDRNPTLGLGTVFQQKLR